MLLTGSATMPRALAGPNVLLGVDPANGDEFAIYGAFLGTGAMHIEPCQIRISGLEYDDTVLYQKRDRHDMPWKTARSWYGDLKGRSEIRFELPPSEQSGPRERILVMRKKGSAKLQLKICTGSTGRSGHGRVEQRSAR